MQMAAVATPIVATPMMVTIPPGVVSGSQMMVNTPSGQTVQVTVPPSAVAGSQIQIMVSGEGAGAVPPRSQEDAHVMLANVPGIEVSLKGPGDDMDDWRYWDTMGSTSSTWQNPFGINTAVRGAFPIKSTAEDGAVLGTLYVACADRFRGDMQVVLLLPDRTMLSQWTRTMRPTMIQTGDTVLPVGIFNAPYGQLETTTWGQGHKFVSANGTLAVVHPGIMNQPQCVYCCASFCCFFPTCGIASCYFMNKMQQTPVLFDLKRQPEGTTMGKLKMWQAATSISTNSRMVVEFDEQADVKSKLAATLASLFFVADSFIDPPSSNNSGAPESAVMER